jgi:hypothetical protein
MGRVSVEMTPQTIGFHGDIVSGPMPGTLENSVFYEVADPVELRGFVPGTPAHPDSGSY